jgi:cell division septation protein DedD
MTTSQCATDPGLVDSQVDLVHSAADNASKLPKRLLIGFASTVTIALGLASWYVGVRIVDANEVTPVSRPAPGVASSAVAPASQDDSTAAAFWTTVAPPPPELYLEVAGLGAQKDSSFVKELEAKGYQARIQVATNQEDDRILIGPFSVRSSLQKAQRKLQSAGVLAIETAH